MKLEKQNVCVFIESEAHLQQARELLERYDYYLAKDGSAEYQEAIGFSEWNFLYYNRLFLDFCLGQKMDMTQITLSELEQILKEEV